MLTNGTATEALQTFARSSSLLLFRKTNGGIRPIMLQPFVVKLAWKIQLAKIAVKGALLPNQLSGPYAAQKAISRIQTAIDDDQLVCTLDAQNAFGEIRRANIAEALQSNPTLHRLGGLFNVMYHASVTASCKTIDSSIDIAVKEGVYQGCAAASFLFSVGLAQALKGVDTNQRRVHLTCIADDIALSTPKENMTPLENTLQDLRERLAACGITLNKTKCSKLHVCVLVRVGITRSGVKT